MTPRKAMILIWLYRVRAILYTGEKKKDAQLSLNVFMFFGQGGIAFRSCASCALPSGRARKLSAPSLAPLPPVGRRFLTFNRSKLRCESPHLIIKKRRSAFAERLHCIGQGGIEPPASWSRTKRATPALLPGNGLPCGRPSMLSGSGYYAAYRDPAAAELLQKSKSFVNQSKEKARL